MASLGEDYGYSEFRNNTYSEAMLISGASKQISCAIFYIFDLIIYWRFEPKSLVFMWDIQPQFITTGLPADVLPVQTGRLSLIWH